MFVLIVPSMGAVERFGSITHMCLRRFNTSSGGGGAAVSESWVRAGRGSGRLRVRVDEPPSNICVNEKS